VISSLSGTFPGCVLAAQAGEAPLSGQMTLTVVDRSGPSLPVLCGTRVARVRIASRPAGTLPVLWLDVTPLARSHDSILAHDRSEPYPHRRSSVLRIMPYRPAGEKGPTEIKKDVINEGYKVDNVKSRVALDVEWNAKDGNLDRDIGAYRSIYDAGIIDAAVLITRTQDDLRLLAVRLATEAGLPDAGKRLGTTTTTNLPKLLPRMTRGDGGGCPILAVAITARCLVD